MAAAGPTRWPASVPVQPCAPCATTSSPSTSTRPPTSSAGDSVAGATARCWPCPCRGSGRSRPGTVSLLPDDPDRTAEELRALLSERFGVVLGIVISDSFGRPWRLGITDVALGVAGFAPLADLRGEPDAGGRIMHTTVIAVADEIASAADLAAGKTSGAPVVLVRGVRLPPEPADPAQRGARGLIMAPE